VLYFALSCYGATACKRSFSLVGPCRHLLFSCDYFCILWLNNDDDDDDDDEAVNFIRTAMVFTTRCTSLLTIGLKQSTRPTQPFILSGSIIE